MKRNHFFQISGKTGRQLIASKRFWLLLLVLVLVSISMQSIRYALGRRVAFGPDEPPPHVRELQRRNKNQPN